MGGGAGQHDDDGRADAPGRDGRADATGTTEAVADARVRRRRIPLLSGIAAVLLAAGLGLLIAARFDGLPVEVDEEWAEEILEIRGPAGIWLATVMDRLGGGLIGVFVVPIVTIVVLLLLRRPWGAGYYLAATIASAGLVQLLKQLYGRARPEDMLVTSDFGSFPSGHVANATTIAVTLGVIVPRVWVWATGSAYVVLMLVSRTYLGVHWLTDTIGGVLVGAGVALILWAPFARPLERERLAWRPPWRHEPAAAG
ncbi:phosphatase PAP2 family protein [Agromyces sp. SYSU T00194]|uniref:phosphatase PAP2 family protein n=1 Tax=Agromyces chitinivorans TaxID=3158560 RepID=UPI003398A345